MIRASGTAVGDPGLARLAAAWPRADRHGRHRWRVHNVFEFADRTVREIMVPRSEVRGLDIDTPPEFSGR